MIYGGTLLLSILSFFTTYLGMKILLNETLALVGSLGLQIALLGIAWNLMRFKNNRAYYVIVFMCAASFSILFSYANFDSTLKENTRARTARAAYSNAAGPVLMEYRIIADKSARKGRYQHSRLNKLIELEQQHGWATLVDEGANDEYVQSVLEGARKTIESWEKNKGRDYKQGRGRGIIVNYLESRQLEIDSNLAILNKYIKTVDSLSLILHGELSVKQQYGIVNSAWVDFPTGEAEMIMAEKASIPMPPQLADFVEKPSNPQQAFMLVIKDLFIMDKLTMFSLALAIVIDLIIILMALGGSQVMANEELIFEKIKSEATRQIKNLPLEDDLTFSSTLKSNIDRFRKACEYNIEMMTALRDYKNERRKFFGGSKQSLPKNFPPLPGNGKNFKKYFNIEKLKVSDRIPRMFRKKENREEIYS